jgi:sirohydrochlorin ferrochelatase
MSLVVLAHGTGNPAGPRTVDAVVARVRLRLPGVAVRAAYADLIRPSLPEVLAEAPSDTVVVPLPCAHDVAQQLPDEPLVADTLGPDRLLVELMRTRLLEAGARPGHPVVLVAAGSDHAATHGDSVRVAQLLEQVWRGPVRAAHLAGRGRRMSEVVADYRARRLAAPAVASYLVAPGHLHARAREDARTLGLDVVAEVLGNHPHVAEAVARRYRAAVAHRFALTLR